MSTTGERLKERRKQMELSADDVASELGVSRSTIFRYENGYIEKVPANILESLADILHTTPAYLMGWDDDPDDWERTANELGICSPNDYDGEPKDWYEMKINHKQDIYQGDKGTMKENISPFVAKDDTERRLLMVCRKAGNVSDEEKDAIINQFEATMDMYLKAKGIKGE